MSFGRAAREQYHLTGSDDALAPDYVKLPPTRAFRDASREACTRAQSVGGAPKQQLPRVPLKAPKTHFRPNFFTKEMGVTGGGGGLAALMQEAAYSSAGPEGHPLARFSKPHAVKHSGRQYVDDGELQKITAMPYNAHESLQERRLAVRGGRASQIANQGLGPALLGAISDPAA